MTTGHLPSVQADSVSLASERQPGDPPIQVQAGVSGLQRTFNRVVEFYWGSGLSDDVPALAWYLISAAAPLTSGLPQSRQSSSGTAPKPRL